MREIGLLQGEGFTVNVPLEVGATDEDYHVAFRDVVVPVLRRFAPDLILVSAGFDAHERDPLAGMRLTTEAFPAMTLELRRVAEECAGGRLVLVTEGGYDLRALNDALGQVVDALAARTAPEPRWPGGARGDATRGREAVAQVKKVLGRIWRL